MSNLSKIINNPILKSNRVIRYSGIYQAEPEALSEHVLSVQFISYLIAHDLICNGEVIRIGVLLEKGLIHDMDEVLTGDIPRPTKYATPESKKMLDTIARNSLDRLPKVNSHMIEVWESAKDQTKEGFLIRLADFLDVYKKVVLEINQLGNKEFHSVAQEFYEYYESINWDSMIDKLFFDGRSYLKDIIREVDKNLKDIVNQIKENERLGMTVSRV